MNFKAILGAAASVSVLAAMPAAATIHTIDFTVTPGSWQQNFDAEYPDGVPGLDVHPVTAPPFGLSLDPTLTGEVMVDDSVAPHLAITGLTYSTGSQVWTLADLDPAFSFAVSSAGHVQYVVLKFNPFNEVQFIIYGDTSVLVSDATNGIFCNQCVTATDVTGVGGGAPGVPEPATWALMLAGFGLVGSALRRRGAALA